MKHAIDVKVNVKPVFTNLVHSAAWEGPCRVGTPETTDPLYEVRSGKENFKRWAKGLREGLCSCANVMEPFYLEFDESFTVPDHTFDELAKDAHEVDIYLMNYRVPGIERFGKAVSELNFDQPHPMDVIGYYKAIGLEAYMANDFDEYNELLRFLQVKKAIANTNVLILSAGRISPVGVYTSIPDLYGLWERYGVRSTKMPFYEIFDEMDKMEVTPEMEAEADQLIDGATACAISRDNMLQDIKYFHTVRKIMEKYGCNAFTSSCMEMCASRRPQKYRITPCLTHTINKDEKLPSACEEDMSVLMAMMVLMYLSKKAAYMGNPTLIPKGTKTARELGVPEDLADPDDIIDEDLLEIYHAVPARMMEGFDEEAMPYTLGRFTHQGFGTKFQINLAKGKTRTVTIGRFDRSGKKMIVTRGEIVGCAFRETFCSPMVYFRVPGGARAYRLALAEGSYGHHQVVVYGDYVKDVQRLGKMLGFEVEIFTHKVETSFEMPELVITRDTSAADEFRRKNHSISSMAPSSGAVNKKI